MSTEAGLMVLKWPFRCTPMTASHSSSAMLKIMRARGVPATVVGVLMGAEGAAGVEAFFDYVVAARGGGPAVVVADGVAAGGSDLAYDLLGGAVVVAGA